MTSLAPTSSSFSYQWTYDVFINFRGEDTRYGFTGNLYHSLCQKGVRTFLDDEELRRGDEITSVLLKTIENSRMAITIFSKNYASSTFCLNELVKIHECIKRKGRLVLPIFYDVDPSEVRHQKENYDQALSLHVKNLRADEDKIQSWKLALHEVSNISGFHFDPRHGYEYQFMERIVKEISSKINQVPLHVATYPVGLESRVLAINSLLQIGATNEVIMVGICGIGGMGKTTIARAVYNTVADNFEGICFYHDIKEDSRKLGLTQIQEAILSEIVGVHVKIQDANKGVEVIKMRLKQKKILLILDNIDKQEQLTKLAGDCNWFSGGSRIIITTRNRHLLVRHGVERIYNMEAFNGKESLELLSWNAFRNHQVIPSYMKVLNRAVIYAQGLPLALEAIGSNLCGRSIDEWESMLDAYKLIPNKDIQQVLRVSYDSLEQVEKEIFLDIACFFRRKGLKYVKYMVEVVHGFTNSSYFIKVLVDKCLVKIEKGLIEIHDLIRDMGRGIVHEESPNKPGKRSRLWSYQDIIDVLEDNSMGERVVKGTDEVRMIIQDNLSKFIEVNWDGDGFKNMKELKILIFENARFSESPRYLPNSLKVLKWRGYPSSYLPPNFSPKKLVELDIGNSYLRSFETIKTSRDLGVLNLRGCQYITEVPDLSNLRNLKKLYLNYCKNLIEIHDSIGYLEKLETLVVSGCVRLKTFPRGIKLPSLTCLRIDGCSSLKYFPEILEKVKITELYLSKTGIEKLPWSICNLSELRGLRISQRKLVTEIPNCIFLLPKVVDIRFNSHVKFIFFKSEESPEQAIWPKRSPNRVNFDLPRCDISDDLLRTYLSRFVNVKHLNLTGNNFTILPAWIKQCRFLLDLKLNQCKHLREVQGIPPKIEELEAINCVSLSLESKRLLLSEMLLGAPERHSSNRDLNFCVPTSTSIPNWFDHTSKGASISFWFRNSFPPMCLCVLLKPTSGVRKSNSSMSASVYINNEEVYCHKLRVWHALNDDHLVVYNLKEDYVPVYERERLCRKTKWNHVQVIAYSSPDVLIEESRIYVIKQLYVMQDIRFTNPRERLLDSTGDDQEQLGTRMTEKEGAFNNKRTLMEDDNVVSSSPPFRYKKRVRNSPINQNDSDEEVNSCEVLNNNQEASLMDLDLHTTWSEHTCDTFRNQGRTIEDDQWLSSHSCWETPFYDESVNHQEFQQQENVTSTNVEQVQESFEDNSEAEGKGDSRVQ